MLSHNTHTQYTHTTCLLGGWRACNTPQASAVHAGCFETLHATAGRPAIGAHRRTSTCTRQALSCTTTTSCAHNGCGMCDRVASIVAKWPLPKSADTPDPGSSRALQAVPDTLLHQDTRLQQGGSRPWQRHACRAVSLCGLVRLGESIPTGNAPNTCVWQLVVGNHPSRRWHAATGNTPPQQTCMQQAKPGTNTTANRQRAQQVDAQHTRDKSMQATPQAACVGLVCPRGSRDTRSAQGAPPEPCLDTGSKACATASASIRISCVGSVVLAHARQPTPQLTRKPSRVLHDQWREVPYTKGSPLQQVRWVAHTGQGRRLAVNEQARAAKDARGAKVRACMTSTKAAERRNCASCLKISSSSSNSGRLAHCCSQDTGRRISTMHTSAPTLMAPSFNCHCPLSRNRPWAHSSPLHWSP